MRVISLGISAASLLLVVLISTIVVGAAGYIAFTSNISNGIPTSFSSVTSITTTSTSFSVPLSSTSTSLGSATSTLAAVKTSTSSITSTLSSTQRRSTSESHVIASNTTIATSNSTVTFTTTYMTTNQTTVYTTSQTTFYSTNTYTTATHSTNSYTTTLSSSGGNTTRSINSVSSVSNYTTTTRRTTTTTTTTSTSTSNTQDFAFRLYVTYTITNQTMCNPYPFVQCNWSGTITWQDGTCSYCYANYALGSSQQDASYPVTLLGCGYPVTWTLSMSTPTNESSLVLVIKNSSGTIVYQQGTSPGGNPSLKGSYESCWSKLRLATFNLDTTWFVVGLCRDGCTYSLKISKKLGGLLSITSSRWTLQSQEFTAASTSLSSLNFKKEKVSDTHTCTKQLKFVSAGFPANFRRIQKNSVVIVQIKCRTFCGR